MSAVLRKKIESGAGVPPSILQMRQFWQQLQAQTRDWAADTYRGDADVTGGVHRVVNGREAVHGLDEQIAFYFTADASPGLSAVAIDAAGAIRNAAARMNQEPDTMGDASPLFLKLLSEQAAASLGSRISEVLYEAPIAGDVSALGDPVAAAGGFLPASRYLQVEYTVCLGDQVTRIWYVFQFDFMQSFARETTRRIAEQKAQARHHSQKTLSDSVRASTLVLDAVLDRLSLTIGECSNLEVGNILPLSGADAARLRLSADTLNGRVDIGSGELGVWKRQRALKLKTPISESFAQEISD